MLFKYKILVLDDSKTYLLYLKTLLRKHLPVHVIIINDPEEAVELLMQENVDLVISDINMPKLDGYEVAKILKQNPHTQNIPIIFLSASNIDIRSIKLGYDLGIIDYLIKPVDENILIAKIKSYFQVIEHIKEITYNKHIKDDFAKARRILDAQTTFIVITSIDGFIVEANKALLRFFGYKKIEDFVLEHDCISDFFVSDDGYLHQYQGKQNWLEVMLDNIALDHKVKIISKDKKEHIFKVSTDGIRIDTENYIVSFTDITELENLKNNLEIKVKEEVEKNRKKDLQLLETAKMASIGEMIANIAHQWRQPLSAISSLASSTQLQQTLGLLNSEDIEANMREIINKTEYLSKTIDTFRNFLKETKERKRVILQERIHIALDIVGISLRDNNIKLIHNIDTIKPISIELVVGELSQVIINIINNAKDILLERKVKDAVVELNLLIKEDKIIISIEDNGGGVPENIISKIFDPYFTTKHKSQGTGLGLHMSYRIVKESLNGLLYVKNTNNGAKFIIEISK
jgi:PAS domain S-box-containing protein